MASERVPLLFFSPQSGADPLVIAQALVGEARSPQVIVLNPVVLLQTVRNTRGFARLKVALPNFSLDRPGAEAAMEGVALPTHIRVGFFGNFEKLGEQLFDVLVATGLVCYSALDKAMLTKWPKGVEPDIDRGFGERMTRVLQRKTAELREIEPDEKRRGRILDAFVKSPEFQAEMAREARREPGRGKKAYGDVVNCYVRWREGRASATALGAVRKLDSKLAAMSLPELRVHIGDAPRLLLAAAVVPRRAAELRQLAEGLGLSIESESA